jgi:hypothetical protein
MPPPFKILTGKIKATAQDLELWIRHCLGQHMFIVEKLNLDDTGKRFHLYFCFQWTLPSEFDEVQHKQHGIKPIHPKWGGAEFIEWSDGTTEIIRMWANVADAEVDNFTHFDKSRLYEERYGWLQELSDEILEKFEVLERVGKKNLDDYTVGFLLEFEKDKTPKSLVNFISCVAYLESPYDPGSIGLMRRVFKALMATKEEINNLKQLYPNDPSAVELARSFEKSYPMLTDENMPEQQVMRGLASVLVEDYKRLYKNPKAMFAESKQFINNSELIPEERRVLLEKIRTMKIGDASRLLNAQPLLEQWKNEFISNQPPSELAPTLDTAQGDREGPKSAAWPRIPKQPKRLNDWKAVWRKVKGRWKGGASYQELARLGNVSPETIADIVKAGDAGLLD